MSHRNLNIQLGHAPSFLSFPSPDVEAILCNVNIWQVNFGLVPVGLWLRLGTGEPRELGQAPPRCVKPLSPPSCTSVSSSGVCMSCETFASHAGACYREQGAARQGRCAFGVDCVMVEEEN